MPANACQIFLSFKKPPKRKGQKRIEEMEDEQVARQLLESMLKEAKEGESPSKGRKSTGSSSASRKSTPKRGGKHKKHAA